MRRILTIGLAFTLIFSTAPAWGAYKLTPEEHRILSAWLARHPKFRAATDSDCNCPEDIERTRTASEGVWKAVPNYHPYRVSGDLNGDGMTDFAVVVLERTGSMRSATLLVFDGPFSDLQTEPTFIETLDMVGDALHYGPPRPKPHRLIIGGFDTDNTLMLVPKGHGYELQAQGD